MVRFTDGITTQDSTRFGESEAGCGRLVSAFADRWGTNVGSTQDELLDGHSTGEDKWLQLVVRDTFRQGQGSEQFISSLQAFFGVFGRPED